MEDYNLLVSIGTLFVLTCTLVVLYLNLKVVKQTMQDQHKWYRRTEALKYSGFFNPKINECRSRLNEKFQNLNTNDAIELKTINDVIKDCPTIEFDIRYILSYYENIGLAHNQGTIDADTMYKMKQGVLIKFYKQFTHYIEDARTTSGNDSLWIHFTALAIKWKKKNENTSNEEKKLLGV